MGGVLEIIRFAVVALRSKRDVVAAGMLGPAIAAWRQLPRQIGIRPQQPGPPRVDGNAGDVGVPGRDHRIALARLNWGSRFSSSCGGNGGPPSRVR